MTYDKMPFGKYKGLPLKEIDVTYLSHALVTFEIPAELKISIFIVLMDKINGWEILQSINKKGGQNG